MGASKSDSNEWGKKKLGICYGCWKDVQPGVEFVSPRHRWIGSLRWKSMHEIRFRSVRTLEDREMKAATRQARKSSGGDAHYWTVIKRVCVNV